jgi:membrane glycosyltransferase
MSNNKGMLSEVWDFLKVRKKWWMLPIVISLILAAFLIILGESSAISPFIYALG